MPFLAKCRLVARGDLQNMFDRKDSPTVDNEGVWIICTFAVSHKLLIHCGDLDHGYFQGELLTEKQLLIPPKNGFLEEIEPGSRLLAIVPIYGTKAAGRGLWKKIRRIFYETGLVEHFIYCALYHIHDDDGCMMLIGTHVDDLIWTILSEND